MFLDGTMCFVSYWYYKRITKIMLARKQNSVAGNIQKIEQYLRTDTTNHVLFKLITEGVP